MTALTHSQLSRRGIVLGAAVTLISAPAIVRSASLMRVRSLGGVIGPQYAGFVERLFYASLNRDLGTGIMGTAINGGIVAEGNARKLSSMPERRAGLALEQFQLIADTLVFTGSQSIAPGMGRSP
jgi:hypothetical protein